MPNVSFNEMEYKGLKSLTTLVVRLFIELIDVKCYISEL